MLPLLIAHLAYKPNILVAEINVKYLVLHIKQPPGIYSFLENNSQRKIQNYLVSLKVLMDLGS